MVRQLCFPISAVHRAVSVSYVSRHVFKIIAVILRPSSAIVYFIKTFLNRLAQLGAKPIVLSAVYTDPYRKILKKDGTKSKV